MLTHPCIFSMRAAKRRHAVLIGLSLLFASFYVSASPQTTYLHRFQAYWAWNQQTPIVPNLAFFKFIQADKPLSHKLREKWLYQLASQKDWALFNRYYQPSTQLALQCDHALAQHALGQRQAAFTTAHALFMSGETRPFACQTLFNLWQQDASFHEALLMDRIILALDNNNVALVRYLLRQFHLPHTSEDKRLSLILKNPSAIRQLPQNRFDNALYLFGLKQLVTQKKAFAPLWQAARQTHRLSFAQQQHFLSFVALTHAIRHEADASRWFAQLSPAFYTDPLLDWQTRVALKAGHWKQVENLIRLNTHKADPCWQYWLARALEAQGKMVQARPLYQALIRTRHYYGFLAGVRLKQAFHFEKEILTPNPTLLNPYQAITTQVRSLYQHRHWDDASHLLSDFASELPSQEKVALTYWVMNSLKWYNKAIALSNDDALKNNLSLRFPLVYSAIISKMAATHHLPSAFIYAMIKQESAFQTQGLSTVGARGLMQLMPTTASMVAKIQHLRYRNQRELSQSPHLNIALGTAYLRLLAPHFQQHPVLMAAAYNAGPTQVRRWVNEQPSQDIDIWIETLPWQETRNYLKNIIAFYAVYQHRLHQEVSLAALMKHL